MRDIHTFAAVMMKKLIFCCWGLLCCNFTLKSQDASDSLWVNDIQELVVTATRSQRMLANVAVPTLLVQKKQIQLSGLLRLNEILQEQTGLMVTSGTGSSAVGGGVFGNGVQIQGLSPDYTLILLDGEPLIGRQGGVMDLSRFTVGNIQKIEVVKGPSSALYGSEAMGGVVNIITEKKRSNYANAAFRYGSFHARDFMASLNLDRHKNTMHFFFNYNGSHGYDLTPNRPERTLDPYVNAALQLKWTHRFSERTHLVWNNRLYRGKQQSAFAINSDQLNVFGNGITQDINVQPTLNHFFDDNLKTSFRLYASYYRFTQQLNYQNTSESYYADDFVHGFYRAENQTDWTPHPKHHIILGSGYNLQTVNTTRYRGLKQQRIGYFFAQNEWKVSDRLDFIPGLRFDLNSDFANRLSPKLAAQYRPNASLQINFSYGAGFKAPDFRQLYLYYVNNPLGYQLYGASEFSLNELLQQQRDGFISRILPEAYQIGRLRPETSHGINVGARYQFSKIPARTEINFFYNAITDLINYVPAAFRNDGSIVFSYLNIREAYTRGLEWSLSSQLGKDWDLELGYQYLQTADRQVLENFKKGEVFGREYPGGPALRLTRRNYTGLLNRSPHLLQAKLAYLNKATLWGGSLRGIYRSAWGVLDLDGNSFANMPDEFARGYLLLNMSVQKTFHQKYTLQIVANNLLSHKDPVNLPQLPGLNWLLAFTWNLF